MAHAVGADRPLGQYEKAAAVGICVSAVAALINPITGAAIGVYFVTDITTSLIADHFRLGESNQAARTLRVALECIVSLGAAFATSCFLSGVAFTLTPGMMALGITVLCVSILASFHRPVVY